MFHKYKKLKINIQKNKKIKLTTHTESKGHFLSSLDILSSGGMISCPATLIRVVLRHKASSCLSAQGLISSHRFLSERFISLVKIESYL